MGDVGYAQSLETSDRAVDDIDGVRAHRQVEQRPGRPIPFLYLPSPDGIDQRLAGIVIDAYERISV